MEKVTTENYDRIIKKVFAKNVTTKDGKKFVSCQTKRKDTFYKVKFTADCERQIKTFGVYDLYVRDIDISIERSKKQPNGFKPNDVIWIRNVQALRKYSEEDLAEDNKVKYDDIFGND